MSTEANATDQTQATAITGAYLIGLVSGAWRQFKDTLFEPATRRIVAVTTATRTVTAEETGTTFHNTGAAVTVRLDLPPATVGLHYKAIVRANQILALNPSGSEVIANMTVAGTDGAAGYQTAVAASGMLGAMIHLVCVTAGRWEVENARGTWALVV
jgi:hypothetical protein